MSRRPDYKVEMKSIATGARVGLCAAWKNEATEGGGFISGTLDREIAKITLEDGTELEPEIDDQGRRVWPFYLNFYDNTAEHERAEQQPAGEAPF